MNKVMRKIIGLIKTIIRPIDQYSPWPISYPLVMSRNEKRMFDKILKKSNGYLEFGTGGSTIRALQKSNAHIYSVDSSIDWFELIRKYAIIRASEGKRLNLFHVNIGATKEWGYPVDDSLKTPFPQYSSNIFKIVDLEKLDTFLLTGVFGWLVP